ncbi:MAG: ATP-binding protein [Chloroflexi bacterium]|nr:ATP-binding protein [Chloroflexota bacterium]
MKYSLIYLTGFNMTDSGMSTQRDAISSANSIARLMIGEQPLSNQNYIPDNIELSYSVEKPFPMLKTDPSFMKRILTNLALNGVQAMQEKSDGALSISTFPREKSVIIATSDTGAGIPDAVKDKIFKPLFTTKSKGQGFGCQL